MGAIDNLGRSLSPLHRRELGFWHFEVVCYLFDFLPWDLPANFIQALGGSVKRVPVPTPTGFHRVQDFRAYYGKKSIPIQWQHSEAIHGSCHQTLHSSPSIGAAHAFGKQTYGMQFFALGFCGFPAGREIPSPKYQPLLFRGESVLKNAHMVVPINSHAVVPKMLNLVELPFFYSSIFLLFKDPIFFELATTQVGNRYSKAVVGFSILICYFGGSDAIPQGF